jgi:hypothetical protein
MSSRRADFRNGSVELVSLTVHTIRVRRSKGTTISRVARQMFLLVNEFAGHGGELGQVLRLQQDIQGFKRRVLRE